MTSDPFSALAHPARRTMLDALRAGPCRAGELTALVELSRSSATEHLGVLRDAGLVREERRGRIRLYHLQPGALEPVGEWIKNFERYWNQRLDSLADLLDEENKLDE